MTANPVMHSSDGVSIRDYIDLRFDENQRAIDKAEQTMRSRLDSMNEFRDTLKDQAGKFITREELQLLIGPLCSDIKSLRSYIDEARGKASQNSVIGAYIVGFIGLALAIFKLFVKG